MRATTVTNIGLAVLCFWTAFVGWFGYAQGQQHPGCLEDEAYVVYEDHNPAHGLSWHCVGRDTLKETK